jgi:hypothetical protein
VEGRIPAKFKLGDLQAGTIFTAHDFLDVAGLPPATVSMSLSPRPQRQSPVRWRQPPIGSALDWRLASVGLGSESAWYYSKLTVAVLCRMSAAA